MIIFNCHECGRHFQRDNNAAGSLVMCPCGAGIRVPQASWSEFGGIGSGLPPGDPRKATAEPRSPFAPAGRPAMTVRDPACCFNHNEIAKEFDCSECKEAFCSSCVVQLEKKVMCGPCKNFYLRNRQRPRQYLVKAILSPIIALAGGFFAMFLIMIAVADSQSANPSPGVSWAAAVISVIPQGVAAFLAFLALRQIELETKYAGRGMAITGLVAALVCSVVMVELAILMMNLVG